MANGDDGDVKVPVEPTIFIENQKSLTFTLDICNPMPQQVRAIDVKYEPGIRVIDLSCYDICIEDKCGKMPEQSDTENWRSFYYRMATYEYCVEAERQSCKDACPKEFGNTDGDAQNATQCFDECIEGRCGALPQQQPFEPWPVYQQRLNSYLQCAQSVVNIEACTRACPQIIPDQCKPYQDPCVDQRLEVAEGEENYQNIAPNAYGHTIVEALICEKGSNCNPNVVEVDMCPTAAIRPIYWSGYAPGFNNAQVQNAVYPEPDYYLYSSHYCICNFNKLSYFFWEVRPLGALEIYYNKITNTCKATVYVITSLSGLIYIENIGDPSGYNADLVVMSDEWVQYVERCCAECDNDNKVIRQLTHDRNVPGESITVTMTFPEGHLCNGQYFAQKYNYGTENWQSSFLDYYVLSLTYYRTPGFTGGYLRWAYIGSLQGEVTIIYVMECEGGFLNCASMDATSWAIDDYYAIAKVACEEPYQQDALGNLNKVQPNMRNVCPTRTDNMGQAKQQFVSSCIEVNCAINMPLPSTAKEEDFIESDEMEQWELALKHNSNKDCQSYWQPECESIAASITTIEECFEALAEMGVNVPAQDSYMIMPYRFANYDDWGIGII